MQMQKAIENAEKILIVSGEGEGPGIVEVFEGRRTLRAIKMRLARERCGGQRWARAVAYSHTNDGGDVYINVETGELRGL